LLDLAITGRRRRGGGIPSGILMEVFGPPSSGKSVLLCEIAGAVQRQGGEVMFKDPESRLDKQFAKIFDFNIDNVDYSRPNTISEVFAPIRVWEPATNQKINGIFADSLAALTTEMEMSNKDATGMRRAKEFSQELRVTCRSFVDKNILMVCSNQQRQNVGGGEYAPKFKSTGGEAISFYSSLRLKFNSASKIKSDIVTIAGKKMQKVIGVETEIEVFKSSVGHPYGMAPICILFDYGIDDIRTNLQYIKDNTKESLYTINGEKLAQSLTESILMIEEDGREQELKDCVIDLWEEIDEKLSVKRKKKDRI